MIKKQMLCLGIDTASDTTSVALVASDGSQAVQQMTVARGQGEALMSMIQAVLLELKKSPKDLTHIAVTTGPGSFTGVRIGLATARGLGLALNIPVLGVDNFTATAYGLLQDITVVLDSKRDDYFVQNFDRSGRHLDTPALKTTGALKSCLPFVACGSGAQRLAAEIGCQTVPVLYPLALSAAKIALETPQKTTEPHPLYLREADVTI